MSKRVGGLQTDWQVMADGFANVFVKYNHTALQLQAAQEDPDTDCAVCLSLFASFMYRLLVRHG